MSKIKLEDKNVKDKIAIDSKLSILVTSGDGKKESKYDIVKDENGNYRYDTVVKECITTSNNST